MTIDLQTRKLNLISYIAELKDEKVFEKIESYVLQTNDSGFSPFTIEELTKRIKAAENDYLNDRVKTQEELEKESANW